MLYVTSVYYNKKTSAARQWTRRRETVAEVPEKTPDEDYYTFGKKDVESDPVYELVDELENEVIRTFDTAMQEIDFVENPYAVFMKLTEIINSDMDFYGALLRSGRNAGLTHKIRLTLQQKAQERFESRIELPPERISVMMDYAVSGMVAVYQSWFNSERRQSIEEISDIASRMCLTGLRGAAADARLKE